MLSKDQLIPFGKCNAVFAKLFIGNFTENEIEWSGGPQRPCSYLQSSTSGTAGRDNFILFVSVGTEFSKSSKKLTFAWFILPGAQVTLLLLLAFKKYLQKEG